MMSRAGHGVRIIDVVGNGSQVFPRLSSGLGVEVVRGNNSQRWESIVCL